MKPPLPQKQQQKSEDNYFLSYVDVALLDNYLTFNDSFKFKPRPTKPTKPTKKGPPIDVKPILNEIKTMMTTVAKANYTNEDLISTENKTKLLEGIQIIQNGAGNVQLLNFITSSVGQNKSSILTRFFKKSSDPERLKIKFPGINGLETQFGDFREISKTEDFKKKVITWIFASYITLSLYNIESSGSTSSKPPSNPQTGGSSSRETTQTCDDGNRKYGSCCVQKLAYSFLKSYECTKIIGTDGAPDEVTEFLDLTTNVDTGDLTQSMVSLTQDKTPTKVNTFYIADKDWVDFQKNVYDEITRSISTMS